ncbi:MAG TPA: phosphoglycerate dehydrogenase [Polyangiaceae bacterium]|jgi:D-3-phosphoglycerate dehydrogenase
MRHSLPKNKIKVLLLEGIHPGAKDLFEKETFQVELVKQALKPADLIARLEGVHVLGIRSKTRVTKEVLEHENAKRLLTVGCFCIGTNQVELEAANVRGVPVFNAPFSNTRSVAELVIAEVVMLARQLGDRSREVHDGQWRKVATNCHEIRGKTLGIVGYGHIGSQVGVLAEAMGMRVVFFDIATKLPMGNNRSMATLADLLGESDFVTLHVPATRETHEMMGPKEIAQMKRGSHLLNLSRGTVVVIDALAAAIREGRVAGAGVDVYPEEPESNSDGFASALRGLPNVILTPHIGGSTEEAQESIGREVATALVKFTNLGTTTGSVNFPVVEVPQVKGTHRILNVHRNVPGVLGAVNRVVSELGANIRTQVLATDPNVGYLVMDLEQDVSDAVADAMAKLPTSIKTRILH